MTDLRILGSRIRRLALLAACLLAPLQAAQAETVLRARLNSDIYSSNPGVLRDENTDAVLAHVVEGLVANREDGGVGPMLAKSWDISADGKTYTFHLRSGLVFHNGAPVTAADAVWSLKRYFDKKTHWRCYSDLRGIAHVQSVTAPDPLTVQVALDRAAPLFPQMLARVDCGQSGILSRASIAADGTWLRPIGTGPFMFGDWKRNQYVDLVRFPRYAALPGPMDGNTGGKRALVDRIHYLVIPDVSAALAALERGSLDILDQIGPTDYATIKKRADLAVTTGPITDMYQLMLQTQDPLLKDVRIRRAIALSIDAAALTRAVTWGIAKGNTSPIPLVSPYHDASQEQRKPDLAQARRLLAQAGYNGQPISLVTNRRYPQQFDSTVLIQAMAAEAGINFQIQILDWATLVDAYAAGKYQAMMFSFSAKFDPSLSFGMLIGDKKKEPRKVWDTPWAIATLKKSAETADPAARRRIFDDINRAFMQDVPAVILYGSTRIVAYRRNVTGFRPWPGGQTRLWNVGFVRGS